MPVSNAFESIPSDKIIPFYSYLLNGAARNMNVNGSGAARVFSFTPPAGQIYYITKLHIILADSGTPDVGEFGNLGIALTNGVLFETVISSTTSTFFNFQDNTDISMFFSEHASTPTGWLNNTDLFLGTYNFNTPITVNQSTSDLVRITIRDNLTGLDAFRVSVSGWRAV